MSDSLVGLFDLEERLIYFERFHVIYKKLNR